MNIGVVGSKVNPLHWGHLFLGESALEAARLDLCYYMPTGQPVDSAAIITPGDIRYEMAVAGTRHEPRFAVSRLEIDREGPSYMVDTMRLLRKQHGDEHNYFLVVGADRAPGIKTSWHEPDELARLCTFLVANRSGERDIVTQSWLKEVMPAGANARGIVVPNLQISSTMLRAMVKAGESIADFVPPQVLRVINRHGLYRA